MNRFFAATLAALTLAATLAVPASAAPAAAPITASAPLHAVTATKPLGYLPFLTRSMTTLDKLMSYSEDIQYYLAEPSDPDGARRVMGTARRFIDKELAWLAKHRPTSCYKTLYNIWKSQLTSNRDAYAYWHRWLRAFPYGRQSDFDKGSRALDRSTAQTDKFTAQLDKTHC